MHAPHLRKFVANRLETALKSALYVFKVFKALDCFHHKPVRIRVFLRSYQLCSSMLNQSV